MRPKRKRTAYQRDGFGSSLRSISPLLSTKSPRVKPATAGAIRISLRVNGKRLRKRLLAQLAEEKALPDNPLHVELTPTELCEKENDAERSLSSLDPFEQAFDSRAQSSSPRIAGPDADTKDEAKDRAECGKTYLSSPPALQAESLPHVASAGAKTKDKVGEYVESGKLDSTSQSSSPFVPQGAEAETKGKAGENLEMGRRGSSSQSSNPFALQAQPSLVIALSEIETKDETRERAGCFSSQSSNPLRSQSQTTTPFATARVETKEESGGAVDLGKSFSSVQSLPPPAACLPARRSKLKLRRGGPSSEQTRSDVFNTSNPAPEQNDSLKESSLWVLDRRYKGIVNSTGSLCYLIAVLQALSSLQAFRKVCVEAAMGRPGVVSSLHCILESLAVCPSGKEAEPLADKEAEPLDAFELLLILRQSSTFRRSGMQLERENDAQEFLKALLATCQQESTSSCADPNACSSSVSCFDSVFKGDMELSTHCYECEMKRTTTEEFEDLCLAVEEDRDEGNIIADAIAKLSNSERIRGQNKYFCSTCQSYVEARRSAKLRRLPPVLTLLLNPQLCQQPSSSSSSSHVLAKRKAKPYRVEEEVNLKVPSSSSTRRMLEDQAVRYRLRSAIYHGGTTTSSGHYVALVRRDANAAEEPGHSDWTLCDDTEVLTLTEEGINQLVARADRTAGPVAPDFTIYKRVGSPYILMYEQV